MKINKRNVSGYLLILGLTFLTIGITTDNTLFTWAALSFVLISLFLGKRWQKNKRKP